MGGTLIKSTHSGDPLGAAAPTGIWLTRDNDKDQWLASELCELALELLGIVARRNRDYWKPAKGRGNAPHKFTNHNTSRLCKFLSSRPGKISKNFRRDHATLRDLSAAVGFVTCANWSLSSPLRTAVINMSMTRGILSRDPMAIPFLPFSNSIGLPPQRTKKT